MHRARRRLGLGRVLAALAVLVVLGTLGAGVTLYAQGYRMYVVHTGSMSPTFRPGDVVIDRRAGGSYAPGEVITFRHGQGSDLVTHRITEVTDKGIHTKGDANRTADVWTIADNQVQGRVITGVRGLGYLMVYLQQPPGIASLATTVFAVLLLWGIFFPPGDPDPRPSGRRRPATVG
jgi:signal peptidase